MQSLDALLCAKRALESASHEASLLN